jgi:hypothetical protein
MRKLTIKISDKNEWLIESLNEEMEFTNRPTIDNMIETILIEYFKSSNYNQKRRELKLTELKSRLNDKYWFSFNIDNKKCVDYEGILYYFNRYSAFRGDHKLLKEDRYAGVLYELYEQKILLEIPTPKIPDDNLFYDYIESETPFIPVND